MTANLIFPYKETPEENRAGPGNTVSGADRVSLGDDVINILMADSKRVVNQIQEILNQLLQRTELDLVGLNNLFEARFIGGADPGDLLHLDGGTTGAFDSTTAVARVRAIKDPGAVLTQCIGIANTTVADGAVSTVQIRGYLANIPWPEANNVPSLFDLCVIKPNDEGSGWVFDNAINRDEIPTLRDVYNKNIIGIIVNYNTDNRTIDAIFTSFNNRATFSLDIYNQLEISTELAIGDRLAYADLSDENKTKAASLDTLITFIKRYLAETGGALGPNVVLPEHLDTRDAAKQKDFRDVMGAGTSNFDGSYSSLKDIPDKINVPARAGAFTQSFESKLNSIEERANVNVQSDWDQTTDTEDNFIRNKPDLSTALQFNQGRLDRLDSLGTQTAIIFTKTGGIRRGDQNVGGVERQANGRWRINFNRNMRDLNYIVQIDTNERDRPYYVNKRLDRIDIRVDYRAPPVRKESDDINLRDHFAASNWRGLTYADQFYFALNDTDDSLRAFFPDGGLFTGGDIALGTGSWQGVFSNGFNILWAINNSTNQAIARDAQTGGRFEEEDIDLGTGSWRGGGFLRVHPENGELYTYVINSSGPELRAFDGLKNRDTDEDINPPVSTLWGGYYDAENDIFWMMADGNNRLQPLDIKTNTIITERELQPGSAVWRGAANTGTTIALLNDSTDQIVTYDDGIEPEFISVIITE